MHNLKSVAQHLKALLFPPLQEFSFQTNSDAFLDYLRERVITALLRLCVLFGSISVLVGCIAAWQKQDWRAIILGNLAFAGVLFLTLRRGIHYKVRGTFLIIFAYLYVFFSLSTELNEFSYVPLFAFVVMTTLLTGRWGGVIAIFVSLGTLLWVNWRLNSSQATTTNLTPTKRQRFSSALTNPSIT